jgi:hypothetical protein
MSLIVVEFYTVLIAQQILKNKHNFSLRFNTQDFQK